MDLILESTRCKVEIKREGMDILSPDHFGQQRRSIARAVNGSLMDSAKNPDLRKSQSDKQHPKSMTW